MLGEIWEKVTGFCRRHKKKLLFGAVFAGGSYYVWRRWISKVLPILRLMRQLNDAAGLEAEPQRASSSRARFEHKQKKADEHVKQELPELCKRHRDHFRVEEYTEALSPGAQTTTKEERRDLFMALEVECFARLISSSYVLHLSLLLSRVLYNVGCRNLPPPSQAGSSDMRALVGFLESSSYAMGDGLAHMSETIREVVRASLARLDVLPQTAVSRARLSEVLEAASDDVDKALLTDKRVEAMLLPKDAEPRSEVKDEKVDAWLGEARDWLDHPQFLGVLKVVTRNAMALLLDMFSEGETAPLRNGQTELLARLFGPLVRASNAMFEVDSSNAFIDLFAKQEVVIKFCEAMNTPCVALAS